MKERFLSTADIAGNIQKLKKFMKAQGLDSFYISTNDIFLNEYVPLPDNHRYYFTNFTGSTAEVIVPLNGKVILFVDGRYFEQADLEVDLNSVEVYKCQFNISLKEALGAVIRERGLKSLGVEGDRIDLSLFKDFSRMTAVSTFNNAELSKVIDFRPLKYSQPIVELSLDYTGESTREKCQRLLAPGEAFYITALDSIAWITNLRRYEMPYQSTMRAKALATHYNVYLLLEDLEEPISSPDIEVVTGSFSKLDDFFEEVILFESEWK